MIHYLKLWLIQSSNKIHFIVIFIILICLSFYNPYNLILLFFYLYYLYKVKLIDNILLIIFLIFTIYISVDYISYSNINNTIDGNYIVIENDNNRYLIRNKLNKYYLYSNNKLDIGDVIYVKGKLKDVKKPSYTGDFNNRLNLFSKYINGYIDIKEMKIIGHRFTFYSIRDNLIKYYENKIEPNSFLYFKALTLGDNDLNREGFSKLNLAHIIAISGFHIVLIYTFIKKVLFNITHNLYLSDNISIIVVILYNILTCFSISVLKATIYLIFKRYNERYDYFTNLDILSFTFIICILRPRIIYNIGFIMGFLSSFILIFIDEIITSKNNVLRNIYQGVLLILVMLPFITKMNNQISILSIFSFLFFDIFSLFIIPYTFILYLYPNLSVICEGAINLINLIILNSSNYLVITIGYMNDYLIYLYYPLLYLFIINNKRILKIFITIVLFIIIFFNSIFTIDKVEVIDVNQGDATLISIRGENVLIDAHNSYRYLLKKGIYKINSIFITHDDLDHISDLEDILNNIDVNMVYTNKYSKVVIDICMKTNTNFKLLGRGDSVSVGGEVFNVLGPSYDHLDDNMNSLVISYFNGYFNFLFTGDMTRENEYELLNENIGKIDILKVAHHGSDTSSSYEFIKTINPKYSIISVGDNKFGLPKDSVIKILEEYSKVYITKYNGNITIYKDKIYCYK